MIFDVRFLALQFSDFRNTPFFVHSRASITPWNTPNHFLNFFSVFHYYAKDDDNFENFQTPKKLKRTPVWSDRPKPTGFLTPSNSMEHKSGGTRNWKQRTKKLSLSQPKQTVELNVKEKELLSSGALNLETLLNDESITW